MEAPHALPEMYHLETVEQMRALADERRQRILQVLIHQPMTVTQVGAMLSTAPAKVHYHVRELERVGLVKLVETREKGGILEKYYSAVARGFTVPPVLLQGLSSDESFASMQQFMSEISRSFLRAYISGIATQDEERRPLALAAEHLWLTDAEFKQLCAEFDELCRPYELPRGLEGEREKSMALIAYDTELGLEPDGGPEAGEIDAEAPPRVGRVRTVSAAGIIKYDRQYLESVVAEGDRLHLTVFGICQFDDDVYGELADRAVAHFRHMGVLNASPEVKAILERKKAGSSA